MLLQLILIALATLVQVLMVTSYDDIKQDCGRVPVMEKIFHRSANTTHMNLHAGDFRILHGLDAMPGEWPWIVKLKECDEDSCAACTGTLLNSRWIISAGHCAFNRTTVDKYVGILGLYDLVTPDATATKVKFDKLVVHPKYNNLNNDVSLFRIKETLKFDDFVQPACLVNKTENVVEHTGKFNCMAVGYGLIDSMAYAIKLQKLEIKPRKPEECNNDQMNNVKLRQNTICIGPMDDKIGGSCQGDSGGPNLCYDHQANRWFIFGTVSYGPAVCDRDSDDKWLTVSVDLSRYREWILSVISDKSEPPTTVQVTTSTTTTVTLESESTIKPTPTPSKSPTTPSSTIRSESAGAAGRPVTRQLEIPASSTTTEPSTRLITTRRAKKKRRRMTTSTSPPPPTTTSTTTTEIPDDYGDNET